MDQNIIYIKSKKYLQKNFIFVITLFSIYILARLPYLGWDFINDDLANWQQRANVFGNALWTLSFADTATTYHPGVTLQYILFVANKFLGIYFDLFNVTDSYEEFLTVLFFQKLFVVITTSSLTTYFILLLKKRFGLKFALLFFVILNLEPLFLGLSRAVHTDTILTLLISISCLKFFLFNENENKSISSSENLVNIIIISFFSALAILTKSSALYLILFYCFIYLYKLITHDAKLLKSKLYTSNILMISFFTTVFTVLIWPALIVAPINTLNLVVSEGIGTVSLSEGHDQIWFGKETFDPGFWFYPLSIFMKYNAYITLPFVFITLSVFYKKIKDNNLSLDINTYYLLFFISYSAMLMIVSKKLTRYSLPLLIPMIFIVLNYYISKLNRIKYKIIIIITLIYSLVYNIILTPNYLLFYSQTSLGLNKSRNIITNKWPSLYPTVVEYINENYAYDSEIVLASASEGGLKRFARFKVVNINNSENQAEADLFLLRSNELEKNQEYIKALSLEKVYTFKVLNYSIYDLYKKSNN